MRFHRIPGTAVPGHRVTTIEEARQRDLHLSRRAGELPFHVAQWTLRPVLAGWFQRGRVRVRWREQDAHACEGRMVGPTKLAAIAQAGLFSAVACRPSCGNTARPSPHSPSFLR